MQRNSLRSLLRSLLALLGLLALGACSQEEPQPTPDPVRTWAWDSETLGVLGALGMQDDGRIKPLSTYAGFQMLRTNGKRTMKVGEAAVEDKLDPVAWILDCYFFPEQARHYPGFIIDNDAVLVAIGVDPHQKKRSRYSFDELQPGERKLYDKYTEAFNKEKLERTLLDRQCLTLWVNFATVRNMLSAFDHARADLEPPAVANVQKELGTGPVRLSESLAAFSTLQEAVRNSGSEPGVQARVDPFLQEMDLIIQRAGTGPALYAPSGSKEDQDAWFDAADLAMASIEASPPELAEDPHAALAFLSEVEQLVDLREDGEAFQARARELAGSLVTRAEARGEYRSVPLEVQLYKADFFYRALYLFVMAFLAIAFAWLLPKSRWPGRLAWVFTIGAEVLLVAGIVMRCVVRSRPPITNLYDTILFIAASGVLIALFLEIVNRRRIVLGVATVFGFMGMFMAHKFEFRAATLEGDTMASLQAVLDTNYYLAVHVTTINLGYMAGLLASFIAHVWIVGALFGRRRTHPEPMRELMRMTYGTLCFALVFSVFGTIYGGVWANDSWGRFWGWDPKENGALMICIWQLLILHARLGGMIKQLGLAVLTILGGIVIAFSWWHVNHLEVGLHTYGKAEGIVFWLSVFYTVELIVVGVALVALGRGGAKLASKQVAPAT